MDRPRYTNQTLSGLLHGKELKENLDSMFFISVKCMYTSDKIDVHDFILIG